MDTSLHVKLATEDWEFDEIHRLNHVTFTGEIPLHPPQPSGILVDRFHEENKYVIALRGTRLMGMVVLRGRRPFSLDQKLPDLDAYLPAGLRFCEIRLLAVAKPHRSGRVLQALVQFLLQDALGEGFEGAVISGITSQLQLYRRLGFMPFGPLVGSPGAQFQPMMLTRRRALCRTLMPGRTRCRDAADVVNLLPGPVMVDRGTRRALARPPESHRSEWFAADLSATKQLLAGLTGARRAEILLGSGTLANDAIAGQLSLEPTRGLILSNGEFGERLVDHASRFGLQYDVMRWAWGRPFDASEIEERLAREPVPGWIWCTHVETSTGVLNDLQAIKGLSSRAGARLCVDAVSSLGMLPVDLNGVWLASGVSGKGLRSFPGLALVFYSHHLEPAGRLPRYLDLGFYAAAGGVPFTHSSNLVRALKAALEGGDWGERYHAIAENSAWLHARLRAGGFQVVSATADAAPGIVSIALPATISSTAVALQLEDEGYALAAQSAYLVERNWLQISLMSLPSRAELAAATDALSRTLTLVEGAPERRIKGRTTEVLEHF